MTPSPSLIKSSSIAAPQAKFQSWRIVVPVLFAALSAVMCAGPGSLAAPATFQWFEPLICPGGQRITYEYVATAGDTAIPLAQAVYCEQAAGLRSVVTERALGLMFGSYFALFLVPALLIGLTVQFGPRGKRGAPRPVGWQAEQELRALLAAGKQAEAARLVRAKTGATPKWAREYLDVLAHNPQTEPPARPEPPAPTPLDKLTQLKKMLDTGLITAKDYEAKKTDILGQM
jgi:hypothetical protein